MIEKRLGKIQEIYVGSGGYDGAMFGVTVTLGGSAWGVGDFKGTWSADPSDHAKWTKTDQLKNWGITMEWLKNLLRDANVSTVDGLKNIPVEITMENNTLKSWRILTEVI